MAARAKRYQPKHVVDLTLKAEDIARLGAAVTFRVRSRGDMLGTIEIGQGGFRWRARSARTLHSLSWPRFFERLERE